MKKDSALVLSGSLLGFAVLVLGAFYFGSPLFGWVIIFAIFLIYLLAAWRDFKTLNSIEKEMDILHALPKHAPWHQVGDGFVAERIARVKELAASSALSDGKVLEILNTKIAVCLGKNAGGVVILLGLMGTFFGLMLSVSTAGSAMDNSTPTATLNSIHAIFSGMKGIFGTSLCGIFASLVLSGIHTLVRNRMESFVAELDLFTLGSLVPAFAQTKEDGVKSDAALLEKTLASFTNVSEQMKTSFEKAQEAATLESEKRSKLLAEEFEKMMTESVSTLKAVLHETQQAMLESCKEAERAVMESAERSVVSVRETKNLFDAELRDGIVKLSGSLSESMQKQSENLATQWNALAATFEQHFESLKKSSEMVSVSFNEEFTRLNASFESRWASFTERLASNAEKAEERERKGLETLADVAERVAEKAQVSSAELSGRVTTEIENLSVKVQESFRALSESSAALVESQKHLIDEMQNTVVKETEASSELAKNLAEVTSRMNVNQSEFAAGLEMFDKGLEVLIEKLSGNTEQKDEEEGLVEQIRRSLEQFHERAGEILVENAVKTQEILLEILEHAQRASLAGEIKKSE